MPDHPAAREVPDRYAVRVRSRRPGRRGRVADTTLSRDYVCRCGARIRLWCWEPIRHRRVLFLIRMPLVPFKLNQNRRHHIPRQRHKVTNWPDYEASLRQRGSLTVWFTEEAIATWAAAPRTTRGGQPWYSPLAILTALTLRAVFRLAFRQTEGLIGSIVGLLGLTLRVPDHTTLSRRAASLEVPRSQRQPGAHAEALHLLVDSTGLKLCGAGEWLVEKHGTKTRYHVATATSSIFAAESLSSTILIYSISGNAGND